MTLEGCEIADWHPPCCDLVRFSPSKQCPCFSDLPMDVSTQNIKHHQGHQLFVDP
jgi:hypothetical protein